MTESLAASQQRHDPVEGATPDTPPVLASADLAVLDGSVVSAASLVSIASTSDTVTAYQFYDGAQYVGSDPAGMLENSGNASGYFTVTAANLSQVTFNAGSGTSPVTTTIYVRAESSAGWGAWVLDTITVTNPLVTPVSANVAATHAETFTASQLFTTADATAGATIGQYEFYVVAGTGATGGFTLGTSTTEPNNAVFYATASQLGQLSYELLTGSETIYVRASDGTTTNPNWGAWATIVSTYSNGGQTGTEVDVTAGGITRKIILIGTTPANLTVYAPVNTGVNYGVSTVNNVSAANALSIAGYSDVTSESVRDSASNISANLTSIEAVAKLGKLTGIALTDSGVPTITVTETQLNADGDVLHAITSPFNLVVTGVLAVDASALSQKLRVRAICGHWQESLETDRNVISITATGAEAHET